MIKIRRMITCALKALFCIPFAVSSALGITPDLKFDGHLVSADLKDVPLKTILDKIEQEKRVWYTWDRSLLSRKVSVQFEGLSLHEALKRILSGTNYSLLFYYDEVVGVYLVGGGGPAPYEPAAPQPRTAREVPSEAAFEAVPEGEDAAVVSEAQQLREAASESLEEAREYSKKATELRKQGETEKAVELETKAVGLVEQARDMARRAEAVSAQSQPGAETPSDDGKGTEKKEKDPWLDVST